MRQRSGGAWNAATATLLAACALALALVPGANGATIRVETDADEFGPAGPCALREAVEAARTNRRFGGCPKGSKRKRDKVVLPGDAVLQIDGAGAPNSAGDLDVTGGGKLTFRGASGPSPDPPAIVQDGSDRVVEITRQRGVRIQGIELRGGGGVTAGGALRVAQGAQVTLSDAQLRNNSAQERGGAIACEGCRSLRLEGAFNIENNLVSGAAETLAGGAVWANRPTVLAGDVGAAGLPFTQGLVTGNNVIAGAGEQGRGGGIYAAGNLTILNARIGGNEVFGFGNGGGIAMEGAPGRSLRMALTRVTVEGNEARGAGGGIDLNRSALSTHLRLTMRHSLVRGNETSAPVGENASGAGVSVEGDATIADSAVINNAISGGANTYGGGIHMTSHPLVGPAPTTPVELRLVRSSVAGNTISGGSTRNGGGVYAAGTEFEAVNATISANSATGATGYGGGLWLQRSSTGIGSGRIDFSTIADNTAGAATGGAGIRANLSDPPLRVRASIIDQAIDGCAVLDSQINSGGFNAEAPADPDCGLDAATDSHGNPFLQLLTENGTPAVGFGDPPPFGAAAIPPTNAFTNNSSSALDIVPSAQCRVAGERLRSDARGAPRPAEGGCDAGAIERTGCLGAFAAGPGAAIGTVGADEINSSALGVVVAQGGNDFISTYGGADRICAGAGNDEILPGAGAGENDLISAGPGRDLVNYNNGGAGTFDLAAATGTGPNIGTDTLTSVENIQGSEGADTLLGSQGRNRLIGGGDPDTIRGRGGIDVIDARDGEADVLIDCGPGKNSKERALIDPGLDPAPKSC